jgi:hypothetical protein
MPAWYARLAQTLALQAGGLDRLESNAQDSPPQARIAAGEHARR